MCVTTFENFAEFKFTNWQIPSLKKKLLKKAQKDSKKTFSQMSNFDVVLTKNAQI